MAARAVAGAPGAPGIDVAVGRAPMHVAELGLLSVRADLATVPGRSHGADALLRATAARLGADGPVVGETSVDAVDRARVGVAVLRLLGVRAHRAPVRGRRVGAAALLRAGAARLAARGPGA